METKGIQQFLNSYSVKMVIVSGLAILLLIPSFLIREIISERMVAQETVKRELYSQWGNRQVVSGPVLNVPYTATERDENGTTTIERQGVAHFLPETLKVDAVLLPETRKRGIYEVVVYESRLKLQGSFNAPDFSQFDLPHARFNLNGAYFTLGVSDMRGTRNLPELVINGRVCTVGPGVADNDLFESGITFKATDPGQGLTLNFGLELVLNGSEDLLVEAVGKTTGVTMKSEWPQPGFTGHFLPESREVTSQGFTAGWQVTHLNRNFPQQWLNKKHNTNGAGVGVELLLPVDHYQKSMRSAKYAILFIALNFIIFIFIEIKSKTRIHPFQYSLMAFALLIFYVLLTSIGEHTGFNPAYLIASVAVTLLVTWYASTILPGRREVAWIALLQTGLYLFLFTILQLQDYALLAGSIGLFIILAAIMRASQKIKWYA